METIMVINRAPKTLQSPAGPMASFGRLAVPERWWNTKPRSVLVPWDRWTERLASWPENTLRAEVQRADIDPLLSADATLEEMRDRLVLAAKARGNDPDGTLRETYADDWHYQKEVWPTVRHYADDNRPIPGNKKILLTHYLAAYHAEREPITDSEG